uniref:Uncharacterized protein n=1 Tax=Anguilla anguilla TaxID=7936 RepID=A0A0E9XSD1_ANGAN
MAPNPRQTSDCSSSPDWLPRTCSFSITMTRKYVTDVQPIEYSQTRQLRMVYYCGTEIVWLLY